MDEVTKSGTIAPNKTPDADDGTNKHFQASDPFTQPTSNVETGKNIQHGAPSQKQRPRSSQVHDLTKLEKGEGYRIVTNYPPLLEEFRYSARPCA